MRLPDSVIFTGEVIKRWKVEDSEGPDSFLCCVDDGTAAAAPTFDVGSVRYGQLETGDLVRVTFRPRRQQLLDIEKVADSPPTAAPPHPRPDHPSQPRSQPLAYRRRHDEANRRGQQAGAMTAEHVAIRTEVVALLIDADPFARRRGEQAHADGRPYSPAEEALAASATEAELDAAAQLQRLAAEDLARRVRRQMRLDLILLSAPQEILTAIIEQVRDACPDELRPAIGRAPVAELTRWQDQQDLALARAIRRHLLHGVSPDSRAELIDILAHLDGGA